MKNRFIRKFLVICAAMLFVCAVSVWAAAEETTPATPTDLTPAETADSVPGATEPETTEPDTTVPDTTEPQDPVNETIEPEEPAEGEDAADAVELVITKAVRVGDSWSGVMKKTKPAILKLDVAQAQQVNLLVQGRHVWIAVEKADRLTENPARTLTENSQAIISWHAEAGSYLITLGPVEPNLMAKANVSILDDAAYGEWLAQQQAEEVTEEEPAEVTEETEEPAEEPGETEESEEPAEETVEEIPEEETDETEETTDEPDEITEEEEETTETPADEEETGEEPAGEPEEITEEEPAEESEEGQEELEETGEETEENIPESEMTPERHIRVDVTWDVPDPVIGDTAHFEAVMEGYDELQYTVQWQYSPDETTWYDIPNETNTTMDVVVTPENNTVYWRILVYVEESQED